MPYIKRDARIRLDQTGDPETVGELNYEISKLVNHYLIRKGEFRYEYLNEVIGALECAKLEMYRRVVVPYEEKKLAESGDIFRVPE